jgi:GntR family transcriptional regulator
VRFNIYPGSPEPIYRQIIQQIRRSVAAGRLNLGEKLPSVRDLARALVVNPNTVAKAYSELERAGILMTKKGTGTFVASRESPLKPSEKRRIVVEKIDALLTEAVHLGLNADELQRLLESRLEEFKLT